MGISSSTMDAHDLLDFKKLPSDVPLDHIEIPERSENRRPTNVKWLVGFGIFILLLLPFLIYTLVYSDPARFFVGHDKCGNVCGKNNYKWPGIECSGKNFTNYPYLEYEEYYVNTANIDENGLSSIDYKERSCVQACTNGYVAAAGRCLKESENYKSSDVTVINVDHVDLGVYFDDVKWQLIISCLMSIVVAMVMLFLFRYAVRFVVWGILIGCALGLAILTGAFWYVYFNPQVVNSRQPEEIKNQFLVFAGTFSICLLIVVIVLIAFRNKIRLVIMLLKEATKAVFDMPGLVLVPLLCVIALTILTVLFLTTAAFMNFAGVLKEVREEQYEYKPNAVMIFSMTYNLVVYLWTAQFFVGIQYMVIAGAVGEWYFSRDKNNLGSPIGTSISNTFKYHLGTIAMGSLFITLMQIIKSLILGLIKNEKVKAFVESCLDQIEQFFKFLSKNAYIITAMHGQAFFRSGRRAAKLIFQNLGDVVAINSIGDFVLGMAQLLIIVITVLISMGIFAIAPGSFPTSHIWSYVIVFIVSLVVASVSFGVFETAIDTIFICYCEDNLLNDGMAKPYLMSRNLKEFVEESKIIYEKK